MSFSSIQATARIPLQSWKSLLAISMTASPREKRFCAARRNAGDGVPARFPVTESVKNRSFGFGFLATSLKMANQGTFVEITVANLWKMGYNGGKFKNYAHLGWR